ncbi:hypothetical protein E4U58_003485 [Claviceps cyperi]|nr:hypothetical protein E4U58_003485 [Claviceps cyperi]
MTDIPSPPEKPSTQHHQPNRLLGQYISFYGSKSTNIQAMLSRVFQQRPTPSSLRICRPQLSSACIRATAPQRRWITPAPQSGDGPLMSRRADRKLPELSQIKYNWARTLPIFAAVVAISAFALLNYEKSSSPIVTSTMYALRTDARARSILGDDIYFRSQIPWIRGPMNKVQGNIDISFDVKGSKSWATMRFASRRSSRRELFETTEWSLTTEEGEWVDLLGGEEPLATVMADGIADMALEGKEMKDEA